MNDLMQYDDSGSGVPQLPSVGGMDAMYRVEIDVQISTAHAYPRKLAQVAKEIRDLVTFSPSAAAGCVYTLPRDGKAITGPSIRLAEILFSTWGNCTGGSRITDVNRKEGYIEAEGVFHDLQKNAKSIRRFRRRITGKNGRVFSDDMIIVTGQAAGAIAFRNAVLAGIPRAMWDEAYSAAEAVIRGDVKTLGERHDASMKALQAFGFTADEVYKVLGIGGRQEFTLDHIVSLTGLYTSLKDGATTKEQILRDLDVIEAQPAPKGIIGQRTATASKPSTPASNPAADDLIAKEAARVAEERAAKEEKARLAKQKAEEEEAARQAHATAQENLKMLAEKEAAEAAATSAEGTPHDPETGEVMDEASNASTEAGPKPDRQAFEALYDTIVTDMMEGTNPDDVADMYGPQIELMAQHFPDLHARLQAEIAAAKD